MSTKGIISNDLYLHKRTKKLCVAFSHYLFVQRLISKAEEYGRIVKYVDESYTSKTCGNCGEINEKLGSNETFKCPLCNFKIKRDFNGARNIYLKHN
jgi:putative transposase